MFADALRAARRSTIRTHKTGAVIYGRDGHLLAAGWSHVGANRWVTTPWSTHAEHHALQRLGGRDARGGRIVIATVSRAGNITAGAPCDACARKLQRAGITEVVATQRSS